MPDFVLGDSSLFVGVYGEVKRADISFPKLAISTEQNDQIGALSVANGGCASVQCPRHRSTYLRTDLHARAG
jgi:hypothetical protein